MLTLLSGHLVHVEARSALYEPGRQAVMREHAAAVSGSVVNGENQQLGGWAERKHTAAAGRASGGELARSASYSSDGTRVRPHSKRRQL